MRVHCDEGVANRIGPEPCVSGREAGGEASAGDRIGQPSSRETVINPGCRRCSLDGRQNRQARYCERLSDPAWSETLAWPNSAMFSYRLDRNRLRMARRREGRYLLRTNLTESDPAKLWSYYLQLVAVEEAFKTLKGDLAIRPIFHQQQPRIEAHIFIAFLAYCLHVTLGQRLKALAPGLTPRSVLQKFAGVHMIDVYVPTTDGRELSLTRYTQPEPELKLLLDKLKLSLPAQPLPKITATHPTAATTV